MSPLGQTAKDSRKALTSELPPITDIVRPRGNALRLPSAANPLRAASGQIAFGFLEIIADRQVAIRHRGPRDVAGWSMVGGLARYVASHPGHRATQNIENRSWPTNYRGPVLIHASLKIDKQTTGWIPQSLRQAALWG